MDIEEIRRLCACHAIEWTLHSTSRLLQRGIAAADVDEAIMSGEIIERYFLDYPFPSCLIFGMASKKPLHVVCAMEKDKLWIITAYKPSAEEWHSDFKTRRENDQ